VELHRGGNIKALACERLAHDGHVIAGALELVCETLTMPASATCGPEEPIPSTIRPPESSSIVLLDQLPAGSEAATAALEPKPAA
jgi:hypothetical protein